VVEPLADVDVNEPGLMEMDVAPDVVQLRVLLEPASMLVGLAVKELIVGLVGAVTVTVTVEVVEPATSVAVRV
jgi:hypothetical protein